MNTSSHQKSKSVPTINLPLSLEEAYIHITQMEAQYDLLQYQVDGWCIWPALRFKVATLLTNVPATVKQTQQKYIKNLVSGLSFQEIWHWIKLKKARYIVKTAISGLVEQEKGLYKDVWSDDLIQILGIEDCFKLEAINNPIFVQRRQFALIKSDLTTTSIEIMALILAHTGGPRYVSTIAQRLSACLQNECGKPFTYQWVKKRLLFFYWLKKLYGWLLKRISPTYLISGVMWDPALTAAAKEQKITVIELQHGIIDQYHSGYTWTEYAVKYKAQMPIPDYFFLYGEHWKQELLKASRFWEKSVNLVGSFRIDKYFQLKTAISKKEVCTLLLTSQGVEVEKIINFMANFLKIVPKDLELCLYIKLHPISEINKTLYQDTFYTDKRVQVLLGNEKPSTFELLIQSHFHLSIYSACHYEALGLGVPTIILPFARYKTVLPLHQAGHAFLVHNPDDLLDIVLHSNNWKVPDEVREYYFKGNALENMKQKLNPN